MDRAGSTYGERRVEYWVLVEKYKGKRLLRRPRRRWEDNIKIDLRIFERADGGHGLDRSRSG
jgi:hypothetical protein